MNFIAKLKRFAWIIAGGLTGAVFLTAICGITLIAFASLSAIPFIGEHIDRWVKGMTFEGNFRALMIAGLVGFVIGVLVCKRHLEIVQKWFGAAVVLGAPMVTCLWLFHGYANHVEIPRQIKLLDCTNKISQVAFTAPQGRHYRVVLVMPSGLTNAFSGQIEIAAGNFTVTNFVIGSDQPERKCNFLRAQTNYGIKIAFEQAPPAASIWLRWLQAYKDKDR